ncbi:unnamed protein product [Callosobruchus maculatus]|uniref:RNA (guanine-9-)-methyltransferase domain-containing protein 1 n=1 Tax=Callosobruchus maculatus TaxID=64391 RepID=A0A653BJ56_CALMS|nr:unnamed protein product [Callosobruchus maculatus]
MAMITRSRQLLKLMHITENIRMLNSSNAKMFTKKYDVLFSIYRRFSQPFEGSRDEDGNEVDIKSITNGDPELEHKLKVILLEAEVMRQEGKLVPPNSDISKSHWTELLSLPSRNARRKMYEYLFKLSKKKENRLTKKLEKRQKFEEHKQQRQEKTDVPIEEFAHMYDLQHNSLFLRIYESTMNNLYNSRLIQAITYGQKLVVDCGYDQNMTNRENFNCAKQLMLLFAENRMHKEPFDIHFCNANPESFLIKQLNKYIPTMYEKWFPLNIHECSYLDIFPKDQLVYLTPHCREEMSEFDHDAVYIIGSLVDKVNNEPLSLAKAKKEGLKMAKLPLDRYLQWGSGSGKSLTLNQVISILLDVQLNGDWNHALRHVPRRKLVEYSGEEYSRNTSDRLKFDKPRTKWVPSARVPFDSLSYQRKSVTRSLQGEENNRTDFKHYIKDSS